MNKKITALTLLTLTAFAAIIGGFVLTAQATETNSSTADTSTSTTDQNSDPPDLPLWEAGEMIMSGGFGGGPRSHGGRVFGCTSMGNIEVSSEYNSTVTAILDNDTDVQNLISEGYTVQSINPIFKTVIEADGTVTTKATTAVAFLQNGTSGYATAKVDITNAKVTEIVIITRTVIDKTNS